MSPSDFVDFPNKNYLVSLKPLLAMLELGIEDKVHHLFSMDHKLPKTLHTVCINLKDYIMQYTIIGLIILVCTCVANSNTIPIKLNFQSFSFSYDN